MELELILDDLDVPEEGASLPVDLGVQPTGALEMRVWFGAEPAGDLPWQRSETHVSLRLPDEDVTLVQIQARDGAGNVSVPATVVIPRPLETPIDHAIALEEHAEDLVSAGDLAGARAEIDLSLPWVKESLDNAVKELNAGVHADRVHVLTTLTQILAKKHAARALLKSKTEPFGVQALHEALELELELAGFADEKGIAL